MLYIAIVCCTALSCNFFLNQKCSSSASLTGVRPPNSIVTSLMKYFLPVLMRFLEKEILKFLYIQSQGSNYIIKLENFKLNMGSCSKVNFTFGKSICLFTGIVSSKFHRLIVNITLLDEKAYFLHSTAVSFK